MSKSAKVKENEQTNDRSHHKELEAAKEEYRRLKLVEFHRNHNDLNLLDSLITKWQDAGHQAIHELRELIDRKPKPSCDHLLESLSIPKELIRCECDV